MKTWYGGVHVPAKAKPKSRKKKGVVRGVRTRSWMRYCSNCGGADVYNRKPVPMTIKCPYCKKKTLKRVMEDEF